ncbi:unnamed protein product, partial [methanotrophic bacterial endosymbiont of Bathymodiolus sp.]
GWQRELNGYATESERMKLY